MPRCLQACHRAPSSGPRETGSQAYQQNLGKGIGTATGTGTKKHDDETFEIRFFYVKDCLIRTTEKYCLEETSKKLFIGPLKQEPRAHSSLG